jgi:hypothetical protein
MDDEIKKCLTWIKLYEERGDADLVCRRCGISRPTLQKGYGATRRRETGQQPKSLVVLPTAKCSNRRTVDTGTRHPGAPHQNELTRLYNRGLGWPGDYQKVLEQLSYNANASWIGTSKSEMMSTTVP